VLRRHPHVLIATDDIYEQIKLSDYTFYNILNACPDLYPRTIVLNGVSKTYSMTGWRIGYCGGPEKIITAMENIQSQSTSNPTSISQVAAQAAIDGDQAVRHSNGAGVPRAARFRRRRLQRHARRQVHPRRGSFYAFPDVREAIKTVHARGLIKEANDNAFCEYSSRRP